MSGYDEGGVYVNDMGAPMDEEDGDSRNASRIKYREFIRTYRDEQRGTFIYREQLLAHYNAGEYYLDINLDHLLAYDSRLTNALMASPGVHLALFEKAATEAAELIAVSSEARSSDIPAIQILLSASKSPSTIREMLSSQVSRLVHIPGIITQAGKPQPKVTVATAVCRNCRHHLRIANRQGLSNIPLPRVCRAPRTEGDNSERCQLDSYQVLPEESDFVDQQRLKLQEAPETVPTGDMPRTLKLIVDRHLVGKVTPGQRVTVTGVFTVISSKPQEGNGRGKNGAADALSIREPYLRVVGLKVGMDTDGKGSLARFTAEEEEHFRAMARSGDIRERIVKSIAPSICGRDDVKAAVACLLFSGTRKRLNDGMHLRGDVNVLLLGDPSVAKSQFLKFAEKVAPIGVYTSGKGSSAAGLTAMVTQEPSTREFYLEGGAMVLADGGIVCIDEFDKMREQDRVAIHEAMEQQTISIAKAGITTVLNSRAAVLAAANPAFGAYDDSQELESNLDLATTILSRFDLIFILRDLRNEELDAQIARHVMGLHTHAGAHTAGADADASDEIPIETLQRYIHYCRTRCFPRLTESAAVVLQAHYVKFRTQMRALEKEGGGGIPVTVRQLEAIVRVSESLAKMELSQFATEEHVAEAIRIFTVSTIESAKSGGLTMEGHVDGEVQTCEKLIKNRVLVSHHMSQKVLIDELCKQGLSEKAAKTAINILVQRDEFRLEKQNKYLKRLR
ncbi:MCM2/3/5 family-domain-containing protein [Pavlovales sp. CCMP2436]|nr:MCM2/3/5 family-domain-containing protein [Pavlovales sp. CCMP2436]